MKEEELHRLFAPRSKLDYKPIYDSSVTPPHLFFGHRRLHYQVFDRFLHVKISFSGNRKKYYRRCSFSVAYSLKKLEIGLKVSEKNTLRESIAVGERKKSVFGFFAFGLDVHTNEPTNRGNGVFLLTPFLSRPRDRTSGGKKSPSKSFVSPNVVVRQPACRRRKRVSVVELLPL